MIVGITFHSLEEEVIIRVPDLFCKTRNRIWKIFTGSVGILSVLRLCKVVWKRKKYFKNRAFTNFQVNFLHFQVKKNLHSNIWRNLIDMEKNLVVWIDSWRVPGSGSGFLNSDLQDPNPNPAFNNKFSQAGEEIARDLRKRLQEVLVVSKRLHEDDMRW